MDVKDLRSEAVLSERNDGIKYTPNSSTVPCARKSYQAMAASPLGKVDASSARPCAVIGPDRVLPPPVPNESLKKGAYDLTWCTENVYRHLPEYPHKLPNYQTPVRNISPRQTFQENMQRIMVPPSFNALKGNGEPFPIDKNISLSKNMKTNIPSETKYCEVPYSVNPTNNEQKNVRNGDLCVSSVNPVLTQTPSYGWPPNIRPPRPYGAPELYQYPEYNSCAGPRPVLMNRSHRTVHEEPAHVYPDHYSHDGSIRYKPYPTFKERYPPTRYEYISNYSNPFHSPSSFPPHKSIPPPYAYSPVPLKYLEGRVPDGVMEGYQRTGPHGNYNLPFRNQTVHPGYGPVLGNCIQNPCPPDGSLKTVTPNKLPYETNKMYLDYENSRPKRFPVSVSENFYLNEIARSHHPKSQILPNYTHGIPPQPYYRKDTSPIKSYEYMPHFRNMDPSIMLSRIPPQFSPSSIAISPSDSNASNDTTQLQGNLQEDCGYVSQSPTTSVRSMDSGINRTSNEFYRRYDARYGPPARTSLVSKPELNPNNNNAKDKKNIDVRQFLQMWNEVDDENAENSTKDTAQLHTKDKLPNHYEINKKQDQLYVLGLVNVPNEELDKYEHIQKVSKLPENIKGYNNIELLNQFEEVIESTNISNFSSHKSSRDISYRTQIRGLALHQPSMLPRPISPLDVEAKISQSVIHKEVGCNFEIKPCSPKMLNVEIATPVQTVLGERAIEKVTNPLIMGQSILHTDEKVNCNMIGHADTSSTTSEILKNPSCKMINTPFTTTDSTRPNYSFQDLESNSGVCLASLPRLDNDIELNFPEVNQQFINANKGESVITKKTNSTLIGVQPENILIKSNENTSQQESESIYELSPITESERGFSKLSKYRKIKKNGSGLEKERQPHCASQNIRTDSVIIKNPENSKTLEQNKEIVDPITTLAESIHDDLYNSDLQYENQRNSKTIKNIDTESNMPTAIDFSLKNENNNIKDYTTSSSKSKFTCSTKLQNLCDGDDKTYYNLKFEDNIQELKVSENVLKIESSETKLLLDLSLDTDIKHSSKGIAKSQNKTNMQSLNQETEDNVFKDTSPTPDRNDRLTKECDQNTLTTLSSPPHSMQSPVKELCDVNVLKILPSPTQSFMELREKENCENVLNILPKSTHDLKHSPEKEICEDIQNAVPTECPTINRTIQSAEKELSQVYVLEEGLLQNEHLTHSPKTEIYEDNYLNNCSQRPVQLPQETDVNNVLNPVLSLAPCNMSEPVEKGTYNDSVSNTQHCMQSLEKAYNDSFVKSVLSPTNCNLSLSPENKISESILSAKTSPTPELTQSPEKEIDKDNDLNTISLQSVIESSEKKVLEGNVTNIPLPTFIQSPEKENLINTVLSPTRCLDQSSNKEVAGDLCEDNLLKSVLSPSQCTLQSPEDMKCKEQTPFSPSSSKLTIQSTMKERCLENIMIASENSNNYQLLTSESVKINEFAEMATSVDIQETLLSDTKIVNKVNILRDTQNTSHQENTGKSKETIPKLLDVVNKTLNNIELTPVQQNTCSHYSDNCLENKDLSETKPNKIIRESEKNAAGISYLKINKKLNQFHKELFSPRYQNLLYNNEGPTNCQIGIINISSSSNNLEYTSNVFGLEELPEISPPSNVDNVETIGNIDNCQYTTTTAPLVCDDPDVINATENKEKSSYVKDSNIHIVSSEVEESVEAIENTIAQADVEKIHLNQPNSFISDNDGHTVDSRIKDQHASEYIEDVLVESAVELPIEIYEEKINHDIEDSLFSKIEYNKLYTESPVPEISNKGNLKRALSDSALDRFYNDDFQFDWRAKRRKQNLRNFIEPSLLGDNICSFQNNRRNSISSLYNQENVSFCILIDNNCIITEEDVSEEQDKIDYTETENSFTNETLSEQCENTKSPTGDMLCLQENNNQYFKSPIKEFTEGKSIEESWVEDIACVETVVCDEITEEEIEIDASSPKGLGSSEHESEMFITQCHHTDKLKHIYGDKMCNDHAQFLETLYRTPQMDVNKTLISRESQIYDECNQYYNNDSLEKILSEPNNQQNDKNYLETLLSSSNSSSENIQIVDVKIGKESFTQILSPMTNNLLSDSGTNLDPVSNNINEHTVETHKLSNLSQDDTLNSCESSMDNVFSYQKDDGTDYTLSSSPEVSSTTSEDRNSGILLKITNYAGSHISEIKEIEQNRKISCKFTEVNDYSSSIHNFLPNRPLITKGAQKYIPPLKETFSDFMIRLPLPQQSLIKLKQLKLIKNEPKQNKYNSSKKKEITKKPKPKFEDVLKSIDEMQFKMHKEKNKKIKKSIPKVVIKKNENGSHYASTPNKEPYNPDLTGRKWQPWVFLEKNNFIDKMVVKNKKKAVYNHRKNTYVLAEKFKKYKSVSSAKFIISQPKLDDTSTGQLKCTIRLKHAL